MPKVTVVEPEISKQVVFNGNLRVVTYVSDVVSPGERDILGQMERAENDLSLLEHHMELKQQVLTKEMAMQEERLRGLRLANNTVYLENNVNYPGNLPFFPYRFNGLYGQYQKGVVIQVPEPIPPQQNLNATLPPVNPETLDKARQAVQVMMTRGVYEEGRLVAVVFDPNAK